MTTLGKGLIRIKSILKIKKEIDALKLNLIIVFDDEAAGVNAVRVELSLEATESHNVFRVIDNGPGIPTDIASKLFNKGFTTKSSGNGLGLFNAKQDLENMGGKISFESSLGKGTKFVISLPKSHTPSAFVNSIHTYKYEKIIVLDDDPAFHHVWMKRLSGVDCEVVHLYSVHEIFFKYSELCLKILLLTDFEIMDDKFDGIDLINKFGNKEHCVLVTARSEEIEINSRCIKSNIKILPKSLIHHVKIVNHHSGDLPGKSATHNVEDVKRSPKASP